MRLSRLLILISLIFIISGCGYKPATYYTKKELKGKVFVNLKINLEDPRNVVLIKDAMNEILVHRLGSKIVDDPSQADTIMNLDLQRVNMGVVQEDTQGYSKVYKATVTVHVDYKNDTRSGSFSVTGENDFPIDTVDGAITDSNRFQGIKEAASKALEEVISKLAINSFKK